MNQVPEKLINFSVYREGSEYLGAADIVLPNIESMTETISGAGIMGEIDSPTLGHFASMTTTINWRTVNKSSVNLLRQRGHALDLRGAQQVFDRSSGEQRSVGVRVSVKAIPKTGTLGNFEVGTSTATSNELEVIYIKIE